jgi:hypothetical protein
MPRKKKEKIWEMENVKWKMDDGIEKRIRFKRDRKILI